jgi:hypothetical protein
MSINFWKSLRSHISQTVLVYTVEEAHIMVYLDENNGRVRKFDRND